MSNYVHCNSSLFSRSDGSEENRNAKWMQFFFTTVTSWKQRRIDMYIFVILQLIKAISSEVDPFKFCCSILSCLILKINSNSCTYGPTVNLQSQLTLIEVSLGTYWSPSAFSVLTTGWRPPLMSILQGPSWTVGLNKNKQTQKYHNWRGVLHFGGFSWVWIFTLC